MKAIAGFFILSIVFYIVSIGVGGAVIWLGVRFFSDNLGYFAFNVIAGVIFWFLWISTVVKLTNLWLERWW